MIILTLNCKNIKFWKFRVMQSYAQTNNCGNFLISVLFLICFFISDLFLIFNELKEEAYDKNGDDE